MTPEERIEFLSGVHVAVLAVVEASGIPLATPSWYSYEPGGDARLMIGATSRRAEALRASQRAGLCVQSEEAPYRYVSIEGPVVVSEGYDPAELRALAIRYLGDDLGAMWMAAYEERGRPTVTISLRPERWYSADYGKSG